MAVQIVRPGFQFRTFHNATGLTTQETLLKLKRERFSVRESFATQQQKSPFSLKKPEREIRQSRK